MKIASRKHYVPNGIGDDTCGRMQLLGDAPDVAPHVLDPCR
jgi:hypothetical protein